MKKETIRDQFLKACIITGAIPYPESKDFFKSDYMRRKMTQGMLHDGLIDCKKNEFGKHYTITNKGKQLILCDSSNMGLLFYLSGNKYINHTVSDAILCTRKYSRAVTLLTMLRVGVCIYPLTKPDIFGITGKLIKTAEALSKMGFDHKVEKENIAENLPVRYQTKEELFYIASEIMKEEIRNTLDAKEKKRWHSYLSQMNILEEKQEKGIWEQSKSFFYCSLEIKGDDKFKAINISGSRALGLLVTQRHVYLVYFLCNQLIKWSSGLEFGMKAMISRYMYKANLQVKPELKGSAGISSIQGLFLIDSFCALEALIENTEKERENSWISLDCTFERWYFVERKTGYQQLKVMTNVALEKQLLIHIIKQDSIRLDKDKKNGKDGISYQTGLPVSFQYFMEIRKMFCFRNYLKQNHLKGIVYCFSYQCSFLDSFYQSSAKILIMEDTT